MNSLGGGRCSLKYKAPPDNQRTFGISIKIAKVNDGVVLFGFVLCTCGLAPVSQGLVEVATLPHNWILPFIFYAVLVAHIAAVAKRHFFNRDRDAIRRMLR